MNDELSYSGWQGSRLGWVEEEIAKTDQWIKKASEDASVEVQFSREYSWDSDYASDELAAVEGARTTLKALEEERDTLRARMAGFQHANKAGAYDARDMRRPEWMPGHDEQ